MRQDIAPYLALFVVLQGCGASYQPPAPKTFARQDQAGTTNIAVLSVDTWDDYVSELQPSYKITEQKALDEIDTVRRSVESTFVDALSTGIALAPPTSGTTSSATTTQTRSDAQAIADGAETISSSQQLDQTLTETEEEAPGDVSAITLPSGVAERATTPTLAESPPTIGGLEPMLKYQAATALFQEIKLLSWYLKKAVQRENYVPYVVRANITVTPRARNEPYDTYLNLSFFSSESPSADGDPAGAALEQRFIQRADPKDEQGNAYRAENLPEPLKRAARAGTPFVIPLLVTDSLESTIHTNVVDQVRQFAFALLFLVKGFGGQAEFERFRRNLERTSGRDLNSLMTVSRLSDNTYRVRLGAMQQVATSHSTIPRNHFITFLLLVPCPVKEVVVASTADWVHAETGLSLKPRPRQVLRTRLLEIATEFEEDGFVKKGMAEAFAKELYWVHANDYWEFRAALARSPNLQPGPVPGFPYIKLWVDLSALLEGDRYASTSFELPKIQPTTFTTRRAVVLDDGSVSKVTVRGAALKQQKIVATLEAVDKNKPGQAFPLDASAVAVSTSRDQAILSFPSIQKLAAANAGVDLSPGSLEVVCVSCAKGYCGTEASTCTAETDQPLPVVTTTKDVCQKIDVAYLKTKKPEVKPGFTLTVTETAVITDDSGRGTLKIAVKIAGEDKGKKKCDKIALGVEGAGVADVAADPATILDPKGRTVTIVGSGALTLGLSNLTPVLPTITVGGKCLAGEGKGASVPDITLQAVINPRWASGRQPAGGAP